MGTGASKERIWVRDSQEKEVSEAMLGGRKDVLEVVKRRRGWEQAEIGMVINR